MKYLIWQKTWQLFVVQDTKTTKNNSVAERRRMKRIALSIIAVLALFATVNCKNGTNAKNGTNDANGVKATVAQVQDSMILGKLYYVNLKEEEQPVMTGLSLYGDRCGTADFSNKPFATEGIRSIFELNEWIEFHPQSNAKSGIKVMVFKHKADQGFYLKNTLNGETPGYIQECELNKDPEAEETAHWGTFYLNPDEAEPGFYDFVFLYNNKVFATMLTKFYPEEQLNDKPDSELENLMKQPVSQ